MRVFIDPISKKKINMIENELQNKILDNIIYNNYITEHTRLSNYQWKVILNFYCNYIMCLTKGKYFSFCSLKRKGKKINTSCM